MIQSAILLIFITLSLGVCAWLCFLWAVRNDQFDDIEGPKYRMLEDDDPLPPHPSTSAPESDLPPEIAPHKDQKKHHRDL